jgi:hypothetical protein
MPSQIDLEKGPDPPIVESRTDVELTQLPASLERRSGNSQDNIQDSSQQSNSIEHGDESSPQNDALNEEVADWHGDIEVLEYSPTTSNWNTRSISDIVDPFTLSDNVQIRLFLVEGPTMNTEKYFARIPEAFFALHRSNVLPYGYRSLLQDCLFSKWYRYVEQTSEQWSIDRKITKGKPYDLDVVVDPDKIQLDHKRFQFLPSTPRDCISLESGIHPLDKETITKAMRECISCYCYNNSDGFIGKNAE